MVDGVVSSLCDEGSNVAAERAGVGDRSGSLTLDSPVVRVRMGVRNSWVVNRNY
jgi:hypothetical protein